MVSDIPAGDGKMANYFLQCRGKRGGEGQGHWKLYSRKFEIMVFRSREVKGMVRQERREIAESWKDGKGKK